MSKIKSNGERQTSKKGFRKNPELVDLVNHCIVKRLKYDEAVKFIVERGFEISTKTYQRIKVDLQKSTKTRFNHIVQDGRLHATVEAIDLRKTIQEELWSIVKGAKTNWEKMKALDMLCKNNHEMAEFYDSSPVVDSLSKKLGQKGGLNAMDKNK